MLFLPTQCGRIQAYLIFAVLSTLM